MLTLTNNAVFSIVLQPSLALHASREAGLAVVQVGPAILELNTGAIMRLLNAIAEAIPYLLAACLLLVAAGLTVHEYKTAALIILAGSLGSAIASVMAFTWSLLFPIR